MDIKIALMVQMKLPTARSETAAKDGLSVTKQVNAYLTFGSVMEKTTVETQEHLMNILNKDVMSRLVIQMNLSARTYSVFYHPFIAMETTTVETDLMNPSTVFTPSVPKISSNA